MELGIHRKRMMCDELEFFFSEGAGGGNREEQMLRSLPLIVVTLVSL